MYIIYIYTNMNLIYDIIHKKKRCMKTGEDYIKWVKVAIEIKINRKEKKKLDSSIMRKDLKK